MVECTYQDWDWVLSVNLGGVINGVQTFMPRLIQRGEGGHICNTASMAAFLAGGGPGIYSCSKYAVRGLTQTLRWHLAPYDIGVSMVCPGLVNSRIYDSEKTRPAHLSSQTGPVPEGYAERLAKSQQAGMEPVEMGEKVLAGIRRNDLYIFTHSEFREALQHVSDDIMAALPDDPVPPQRLAWEQNARQAMAAARAKVEEDARKAMAAASTSGAQRANQKGMYSAVSRNWFTECASQMSRMRNA